MKSKFSQVTYGSKSGDKLLLIDNYDSFTFNIVQYLLIVNTNICINVVRNDAITIEDVRLLNPRWIVISPGPGHPLTDSGICLPLINEFKGLKPILGICMGLQCIFTVFGGDVVFAGEIVHGKTSTIAHDNEGVFKDIPQNIATTRYHSLAGSLQSVPTCLKITCKTSNGVIMGVRHKEYTVEGLQFHPESILSEGGKLMLKNFLALSFGTWKEESSIADKISTKSIIDKNFSQKSTSILNKIMDKRMEDYNKLILLPGFTLADLQIAHNLALCPPLISIKDRMRSSIHEHKIALMAEFKRNSPSKSIDSSANAPSIVLKYAKAGAAVISCLTEPHWFEGSCFDLLSSRLALEAIPDRPALLRKDFIFSPYQILEARLNGADSVLLIVKALTKEQLIELLRYSRDLKMEPLVEVCSEEEMAVAMEVGADIIGVNNRDLHTFKVDLTISSKCAKLASQDKIVCALSGISSREEISNYELDGIKGFLIGTSLMLSPNIEDKINELFGYTQAKIKRLPPLVKICGTRTVEAALTAARSGADFVGMILVPTSKRFIDTKKARKISNAIRSFRLEKLANSSKKRAPFESNYFERNRSYALSYGPFSVAIVQNMSLDEIDELIYETQVDFIQFHGQEPLEWCRQVNVPCLKAFTFTDLNFQKPGHFFLPLLDASDDQGNVQGGTGKLLPMDAVQYAIRKTSARPILSGGLTPDNVVEYLKKTNACGVDVCSGCETNGLQDPSKIKLFIQRAKSIKV